MVTTTTRDGNVVTCIHDGITVTFVGDSSTGFMSATYGHWCAADIGAILGPADMTIVNGDPRIRLHGIEHLRWENDPDTWHIEAGITGYLFSIRSKHHDTKLDTEVIHALNRLEGQITEGEFDDEPDEIVHARQIEIVADIVIPPTRSLYAEILGVLTTGAIL
jgi:hypothetical protein